MTNNSTTQQIEVITLRQFLENANNGNYALPLIQRGSVWKNDQILDLWDSLLKGMPIGSFMTCEIGDNYKTLVNDSAKENAPKIGLFDGQQRTLSMLLGWRKDMPKKIWVDLEDKSQNNYKFCLRISSGFQPIGYDKNYPNSKYSLAIRRADENQQSFNGGNWRDIKPLKSVHSIDLQCLIASMFEDDCKPVSDEHMNETARKNFDLLIESIKRFLDIEIALIPVPKYLFDTENNETPPAVQLFERLGRGGTQLSQADFIYSSIKFQSPESHELVESLIGNAEATIARLQTPTQLVLCALRLSIAEAEMGIADISKPDVNYFHRLTKEHPEFLNKNFSKLFVDDESQRLSKTYGTLLKLISYKDDFRLGFPQLALTLLDEYLIQCLLRWVRVFQHNKDQIDRKQMIQFALYWVICVKDKEKASKIFFEKIKETGTSVNVFVSVYRSLTSEDNQHKIAYQIYRPEYLESVENLVTAKADKLIGWRRFYKENDDYQHAREFYGRFWKSPRGSGHVHPLLLWLQRSYVADTFKEVTPIISSDDDTPYDYDHICPQSHWNYWTGVTGKERILDFMFSGDNQYWITGNAIGNIRVIDSSTNRSDGDSAQTLKLNEDAKNWFLLGASDEESKAWKESDPQSDNLKLWDEKRVAAFQRAVELRTFLLYKKFYEDLDFKSLPTNSA